MGRKVDYDACRPVFSNHPAGLQREISIPPVRVAYPFWPALSLFVGYFCSYFRESHVASEPFGGNVKKGSKSTYVLTPREKGRGCRSSTAPSLVTEEEALLATHVLKWLGPP